jgi:hypothetical protein
MKLNGKILITDPCYITTDEAWDDGIYNEDLSQYGNFIQHDTGIGDISGGVFVKGKLVGDFCVDAGMFGVFQLDQLKQQKWFDKNKFKNLPKFCYTIVNADDWNIVCIVDKPNDDSYVSSLTYKFIGSKNGVQCFEARQTGF